MKAGRPTYRVKARWITYECDDAVAFYELDSKGNIVKDHGKMRVHHSVKFNDGSLVKAALLPSAPLAPVEPITAVMTPDQPTSNEANTSEVFDEMDNLFAINSFYDETIEQDVDLACYEFF